MCQAYAAKKNRTLGEVLKEEGNGKAKVGGGATSASGGDAGGEAEEEAEGAGGAECESGLDQLEEQAMRTMGLASEPSLLELSLPEEMRYALRLKDSNPHSNRCLLAVLKDLPFASPCATGASSHRTSGCCTRAPGRLRTRGFTTAGRLWCGCVSGTSATSSPPFARTR